MVNLNQPMVNLNQPMVNPDGSLPASFRLKIDGWKNDPPFPGAMLVLGEGLSPLNLFGGLLPCSGKTKV